MKNYRYHVGTNDKNTKLKKKYEIEMHELEEMKSLYKNGDTNNAY